MKNIRIALLACLMGLMAVACEKDDPEAEVHNTDRFKLEMAPFADGNGGKIYFQFDSEHSSLIYEVGDQVQINGHVFTIQKINGSWYATGTAISAPKFYAAYVDGTLDNWNESTHTYGFNINSHMGDNTHNKIILAGTSDDGKVLTMTPMCAIIRINTGARGSSWTNVKVGFGSNKVLKRGTLDPNGKTLAPGVYMDACAQGNMGDMLAMRWSKQGSSDYVGDEDGYWYVAVPIVGSSVTTKLYFMWNDGSNPTTYFQTNGEVTLQRGYVYTVGTTRQSPFTDRGYGKYYFYVNGSNDRVAFSAGNLQCKVYTNEDLDDDYMWQFASSQLDIVGSVGNDSIGANGQWFDLFGYGTSGCSVGGSTAYLPKDTSTNNEHYYFGSLNGTNADWAVYNRTSPGIYYGNTLVQFNKFRTLTNTEWSYIINRSGKAGLVRIDPSGANVFGLMLLPNTGLNGAGTWDNTSGVDISDLSLSSEKSLSTSDWGKLEAIGAIFLPAAGSRTGTTVSSENALGYYWTSTTSSAKKGYSMYFTGSQAGTAAAGKSKGFAVRLVAQVGSYTPVE